MVCRIYEEMNIPESCIANNTIFKKLFHQNGTMTTSDKELFKNNIDKIIWKYSFKEETLNIKPFKNEELDYEEVALIEVHINNDSKYKRICEIIQKTIPYPLIIVLIFEGKVQYNAAYKRINKVDESKNAALDFIYSPWIDSNNLKVNEISYINSIDIMKFSFVNMYKFYCSFVEKINLLNASIVTGDYESLKNKDVQEVNKLNNQIEDINNEIDKLKNQINREKNFNRKIDINIQIKNMESERSTLIDELRK